MVLKEELIVLWGVRGLLIIIWKEWPYKELSFRKVVWVGGGGGVLYKEMWRT